MKEVKYTIHEQDLLFLKKKFENILETLVVYDTDHEEMQNNCIKLHHEIAKEGIDWLKKVAPSV
jgi:hypothetical protein